MLRELQLLIELEIGELSWPTLNASFSANSYYREQVFRFQVLLTPWNSFRLHFEMLGNSTIEAQTLVKAPRLDEPGLLDWEEVLLPHNSPIHILQTSIRYKIGRNGVSMTLDSDDDEEYFKASDTKRVAIAQAAILTQLYTMLMTRSRPLSTVARGDIPCGFHSYSPRIHMPSSTVEENQMAQYLTQLARQL